MFRQTKRLFGIAPARTDPLVCDFHLMGPSAPAPTTAEWQEDLDSLFVLVDAQMVERRGVDASGVPSDRTAPGTDPEPADPWMGFGHADPSVCAAGDAPATPGADASVEAALARAFAAGLPQSFRTELRALLAATVHEAVATALHERAPVAVAPPSGAPAGERDPGAVPSPAPDLAPSAVISIRIRRARASQRSRAYARPSARSAPGGLGLASR